MRKGETTMRACWHISIVSTARAHAYVYGADTVTGAARIGRFYTETFPREVRRSLLPIALCTLLTIACASVGYVVIRVHPLDAYALLPDRS